MQLKNRLGGPLGVLKTYKMETLPLPNDLIEKIRNIVYSMNYQPKCLLDDISNFYETRSFVINAYQMHYGKENEDDLWWLINDLVGVCNNGVPTMNGFTDCYKSILSRSLKKINPYILQSVNVKRQINIWWGLLTTKERNQLKNNCS